MRTLSAAMASAVAFGPAAGLAIADNACSLFGQADCCAMNHTPDWTIQCGSVTCYPFITQEESVIYQSQYLYPEGWDSNGIYNCYQDNECKMLLPLCGSSPSAAPCVLYPQEYSFDCYSCDWPGEPDCP